MTEVLSATLFETINEELPNNQAELKKIKALITYDILKDGKSAGTWTLDLRAPPGSVYKGEPKDGSKPTCSVTVEDQIFVALAAGELEPTKAFMSGKVKAKGNIMVLQKLSNILKAVQKSKM